MRWQRCDMMMKSSPSTGRQQAAGSCAPTLSLSTTTLWGNWVILAVQLVSTGSRMRHAAWGIRLYSSCCQLSTVDVASQALSLSPRKRVKKLSRERVVNSRRESSLLSISLVVIDPVWSFDFASTLTVFFFCIFFAYLLLFFCIRRAT